MYPTLFYLKTPFGVLAIHAFGVALAASVLLGWYMHRKDGAYANEATARLYFVTVLVAVVGARLGYVLTHPAFVRGAFDVFAVGDGGLYAFGALFAVLAFFVALARSGWAARASFDVPAFADVLALPAVLAAVFGALGAYLAGADFGRPLGTFAPKWLRALGTFPSHPAQEGLVGRFRDGPAVLQHQRDAFADRVAPDAASSLPVHPVQLYEALSLGFLALAIHLYARRDPARGRVTLVALFGYGAVRLFAELFRGDPERIRFGMITLPGTVATLTMFGAAALFARQVIASRRDSAATA